MNCFEFVIGPLKGRGRCLFVFLREIILKTASQKQPGAWPSTAMSGAHSGTLAMAHMLTVLTQFLKSSLCREDFTANTYSKRWAALQAPELPCSKLKGVGGDGKSEVLRPYRHMELPWVLLQTKT